MSLCKDVGTLANALEQEQYLQNDVQVPTGFTDLELAVHGWLRWGQGCREGTWLCLVAWARCTEWCVPSPKEVARMMNTAALPSLKRRVGPWKRADHLSGVYDT